jgi:hypothetical protein
LYFVDCAIIRPSQKDIGGPLVIDVNKGRLSSGFENSCRFMQVGVFHFGDGTSIIVLIQTLKKKF